MGIFSNELAPNLFNSYSEWYQRFLEYREPNKAEVKMASRYFENLNHDFEIVCDRCGHHLAWCNAPDVSNGGQNEKVSGLLDNFTEVIFHCDHCRQALADNAMFGGEDQNE